MRRKLQTALFLGAVFLLLFISFFSPEERHLHRYPVTTTTFHNPQHRQSLAIRELELVRPHPLTEAVLLPDWEVLLLLPPLAHHHATSDRHPPSCLFQNGAVSPANYSGALPRSSRHTFRCTLPSSTRRLRPLYAPSLKTAIENRLNPSSESNQMLRWNMMAYESISTADDVILFAKGVNHRQGANRPASDLRCVFYSQEHGAGAGVRTVVTSSSQEVFRCLHPAQPQRRANLRISLEIGAGRVIPSLAQYQARVPAHDIAPSHGRSLLCACTMVHNVAKFLREWVVYHSRIGVERFVLYDNGSDDDLDRVVTSLREHGYNVSTLLWPWAKTQEAGFSHCAVASRDSCTWMMFLDVDEFVHSPNWANSPNPSRHMLRSLLPRPTSRVGQVYMRCYEFGPSGQKSHPVQGVTQGYMCRRRTEERHKSIVLLEAVDESLVNVIHHFRVGEGYRVSRLGRREAVVNHYKYQAWEEFRNKFRRRVSAYVADWTQAVNPGSKDRTPGLGYSAVEPRGWANKFCEVNDTGLRDVSMRWFGVEGPSGEYKMAWEGYH